MTAFNQFKQDFYNSNGHYNNIEDEFKVYPSLVLKFKNDNFDGRVLNDCKHLNN